MKRDDRDGPPSRPDAARADRAPRSDDHSITPNDEPSALERGARIFERLARRGSPRRKDPD